MFLDFRHHRNGHGQCSMLLELDKAKVAKNDESIHDSIYDASTKSANAPINLVKVAEVHRHHSK